MKEKKEARELAGNTGNNLRVTGKSTKRKRINHYELAYKWTSPIHVSYLERRIK